MLSSTRVSITIGVCCALLSAAAFAAKTYYRYTNDQGVMVLDDTIPAKYVKQGYSVVDQNGKVLKVVSPSRTDAERQQEKRLLERKATQEKLRLEQESNDRVLLKTFTSTKDIIRVRDNKLKALDSTIQVIQGTIIRLNDQLKTKFKEAAGKELSGLEVPAALHSEIADIQEQIENNKAYIEEKNQEKLAIKIKSNVDLKRFKELMGDHSAEALSKTSTEEVLPQQQYRCPNLTTCNRAWTMAQIYVQKHATTSIQILSVSLIASGQPQKEDDVSLAVTKTPLVSGAAELSIEAHCHLSHAGEEMCKGEKVKQIINGFYDALIAKFGESSDGEMEDE